MYIHLRPNWIKKFILISIFNPKIQKKKIFVVVNMHNMHNKFQRKLEKSPKSHYWKKFYEFLTLAIFSCSLCNAIYFKTSDYVPNLFSIKILKAFDPCFWLKNPRKNPSQPFFFFISLVRSTQYIIEQKASSKDNFWYKIRNSSS